MTPAGGTFGADGVVDASGAVAPHVVLEPEGATPPAGEANGVDVPGGGAGETAGSADPAVKPMATLPKTATTAKTTVTKTAVSSSTKPKATAEFAATLPKTDDSNWLAASTVLILLGTVLLDIAHRC